MSETVVSPSASTPSHYDGEQFSRIGVDLLMSASLFGAIALVYFLTHIVTVMIYAFRDGGGHDIEQGFPRVLEKGPSSEMQKSCSFSEVSWAAFREKRGEDRDTSSECCICIDEFKDEDQCRVCSKCNHIYHKECIDEWLRKDASCPLCRGRC